VSLRPARLLTTLAVVGLCTFAIIRGWSVTRFAAARGDLGFDAARAESLRGWVGTPGLGGEALTASLAPLTDPVDAQSARSRATDLTGLVSVRPLSSQDWLSLAAMRLVAGQPQKEIIAALEMSWLTGPNEGPVMAQRGLFGLLQWEVLPEDVRKRALDDLAAAILASAADDGDLFTAKKVLSAKSPEARRLIAALLKVDGVSGTQIARLGL
jgi:hypothetical protein